MSVIDVVWVVGVALAAAAAYAYERKTWVPLAVLAIGALLWVFGAGMGRACVHGC